MSEHDFQIAMAEMRRQMFDAFCGVRCMDCEQPIWWHWLEKGTDLDDFSYGEGFEIELRCRNPKCKSVRRYGPEHFERFPWRDPAN
jgi:hypothetical protein